MTAEDSRLTPEQRRKAEELFASLDGLPADSRAEALSDSGCEEAVRDAVQRRLSAFDATLAEDAAEPGPSETAPLPEGGGAGDRRIGSYTIRRLIGTGGMGQVFEAMQDQPRRAVALKLMRSAIASESARRRFEYEVQILGRLRHPNIAQIYDAGVWAEDGQESPYFAMEYVPGRPIDDHVREHGLDLEQRLELFLEVCDAISHGHERGIIHRDLKPGNILVDAGGHAKVIDFGVARATDGDLRATEAQTEVGQLIGTIQYMSPEQCAADPAGIDIRSDVYALGVVLFELIADRLPYDLGEGGLPEAIRVIREDRPTRLSTLNESVPRDVEVIVGKALEKEPSRRYRSAGELADDIRRFLDDEAIVARPPSLSEHVRRYARKHRAIASAVVFVSVVLVVSVVAIIYFAVEADRQRDLADREARAAEVARAEAVEEADRANANFLRLRRVFGSLFGDLQLSVRNLRGGDEARSLMVEMGREQIRQLESAGTPEERAALRPELARSHEALGDLLGGERTANLGRPEEAVAEYRRAIELWRAIGLEADRTEEVVVSLARVLRKESDLHRRSDPERARELLDEARPMVLRAIELDPDNERLLRQHYLAVEALGNLLCEDPEDVASVASGLLHYLEHRDLALRLATARPDDLRYQRDHALALRKIGWARSRLDQLVEAEESLLASLAILERNVEREPDSIRHRRDVGWGNWYLGEVLVLRGRVDLATGRLLRCAELLVLACSLQPGSADYRGDVGDVLPVIHAMLIDLDRSPAAGEMIRSALLVLQPVGEADPDNLALDDLMVRLRELLPAGS